MYRSGFEEQVAKSLKRDKVKFEYESEKIPYVQPSVNRKYTIDFKLPNGVYVETKGRFTASDRKKMLWVKETNPNKDIRLLFQRDNYLTKSRKTRYSDWATKNGFKYAVGNKVPKEWLK